jgi:hypothetical protein
MESTRQQKYNRAQRQHDIAEDVVRRIEKKIARDGILQAPEIGTVLALACAISIVKWHQADAAIGNDLAGMALRSIIKNLIMRGVPIPDLTAIEGWTPPNVHFGAGSQQ